MLGSGNIDIPLPGEAKTYIFDTGNSTVVEIAVIQENEKICTAESYNILDCSEVV
jgi:hypothetical protein